MLVKKVLCRWKNLFENFCHKRNLTNTPQIDLEKPPTLRSTTPKWWQWERTNKLETNSSGGKAPVHPPPECLPWTGIRKPANGQLITGCQPENYHLWQRIETKMFSCIISHLGQNSKQMVFCRIMSCSRKILGTQSVSQKNL